MEHQTTSPMRVALCEHICKTVMLHGDAIDKAQLAADLNVRGFESMPDSALIDMARRYVAGETVDAILDQCSAVRYECTELFVCPSCRDQRFVLDEEGRYDRCLRCNLQPEPEEPTTKRGRK